MGDKGRDRNLDDVRKWMGAPIPVAGKRVVDVGCGEGNVILQAEKEGAIFCVGLEVDFGILRKKWGVNFQELWHRLGLKDRLRSDVMHVEDGKKWLLKDASADVVICSFVFPYAKHKLHLFEEVVRILAPGGCAYLLNAGSREQYTSMEKTWSNAFLLVEEKSMGLFERLKGVVESRELANGKWKEEKSPEAREFGKKLDEGIKTPELEERFKIEGIEITAVNFHMLFEEILEKCDKLKFKRSGLGIILEKSIEFSGKDEKKFLRSIKKDRDYPFLNISLSKQGYAKPAPSVLTVLDSRIIK